MGLWSEMQLGTELLERRRILKRIEQRIINGENALIVVRDLLTATDHILISNGWEKEIEEQNKNL